MSTQQDAAPAASGGRRVHWVELLFDLVMVAAVAQIARTMHGDPQPVQALAFAGLLITVWWAWINASVTMNIFGRRITAGTWLAVFAAMAALGVIAAAAPGAFTDRSVAFALGNAAIRVVWMLPWLLDRRTLRTPLWRPVVYCGLPAALWAGSLLVPEPARFTLWAAAVVVEIVMLAGLNRRNAQLGARIDLDHLIERVTLLVVIVFGESVMAVIGQLDAHWSPRAAGVSALAFLTVVVLAWTFFALAPEAVDRGLHRMQREGSLAGLRDAVMYLPLPLIAGVVLLAAGLGTAVGAEAASLPSGAAWCIAGGMSLFFLSSTAESLRYGAPWRDIAGGSPAGVVLPWLVLPAAGLGPAPAVAAAAAVAVLLAAMSGRNARRVHARGAAAGTGRP